MSINTTAPISSSSASGQTAAVSKINPLLETGKGKGEDHFSFWDVLDVINPLQHIPIINNIYRKITGDEINNTARVAGDALYGGIVGAAFGLANAIAVHTAGDDLGGVALSKMGILKSQEESQTADAKPAADAVPDLKNIPMVEVHPRQEAKADTKTDSQEVASAAGPEAMPPAMPDAKSLNDITPGDGPTDNAKAAPNPDATIDPSVSKKDVQKNMMDALNKYNAMQNADTANAIIPNPAAVAANAPPKNIFAMPAAVPVNVAMNDTPAVKKPTQAFNKLRHYSR